jgi:hypothetical protein
VAAGGCDVNPADIKMRLADGIGLESGSPFEEHEGPRRKAHRWCHVVHVLISGCQC